MTQPSAPVPQPQASGNVPPTPSLSPSPNLPAVPGKIPPLAPPGGAAPEEVERFQPQLPFWHRKWVIVGMPIATSVLFHAGLFVVMVILAIVFGKAVFPQATQHQSVIPDSKLATETPGGVQFVGMDNDPFKQAFQDKVDAGTKKGFSDTKGPKSDPSEMGGGSGDSSNSVIAPGASGNFGTGTSTGSGVGNDAGSGNGAGGPLAEFGHPGGGGQGLEGPVFGNGGDAMQIAFVCDASGSMMEKMEALKKQLQTAVTGLAPYQKFSVTFFQDQKATFIDRALIVATPENKRKATEFLADVQTAGTTDPIPGLDLAFAQHPDLVYLLTDGDFPENDAVLAEIHKLNPGNKIKINTIAFTASSDKDVNFRKLLKQIADETGGTFLPVNEEELD